MCCSTLRFLLPAAAVGLLLSADDRQEAGVLHVRSQGYSRFEIDEENVVAYYTGGVEFTYLGYELRADELRFNQATRQASVNGTVQLRSEQFNLDLPSLELDAESGAFTSGGVVTGSLSFGEVMFSAGRLSGTILPQQDNIGTGSLDLELSEGVTVVYGPAARLTASSLRYSSAQRTLRIPARFELVVDPGAMKTAAAAEPPLISPAADLLSGPLTLSGSSLEGTLNPESGVLTARIVQPTVDGQSASLSGDIATLDFQQEPGLGERWAIAVSGRPATLRAALNAVPIALQATSLTMASGQAGRIEAQLSGNVTTSIGSTGLTSDSLVLTLGEHGLSIADSDGLRIGLDLGQHLDMEPVDVSSLGLTGVP